MLFPRSGNRAGSQMAEALPPAAVTITGLGGVDALGLAFSPPPAEVPIQTP